MGLCHETVHIQLALTYRSINFIKFSLRYSKGDITNQQRKDGLKRMVLAQLASQKATENRSLPYLSLDQMRSQMDQRYECID